MDDRSVEVLHSLIVDPHDDLPLHAQVRRVLRQALDEHFEDGQRFWTETALIQKFKVSQVTVRRALADLSREGVLERRVAKGSFVRKGPRITTDKTATYRVGVFLPEWDSPVLSRMLENLNEVCWDKGFRLQVFHTRKGQRVSDACQMLDYAPHEGGAVLFGNMRRATFELHEALSARSYRTINIDECAPDYAGPYVGVDNALGMKLGIEHLLDLGHRRITLLVNEPEENGSIASRSKAFEVVADKMGIESSVFRCQTRSFESSYEAAYRKMEELWAVRPRPSAIFAVSDPGALAAMRWFSERGIRVPQEVSLLGFDNDPASRLVHPGLSTLDYPASEVARHAVEMLRCEKDELAKPQAREAHFPPKLIVRGSTAAQVASMGKPKRRRERREVTPRAVSS